MLVRAQGHTAVYTVLGGLDGWKDEVLFPVMPAEATAEQRARFERSAALAKFFGGQARVASEATPASGAAPMTPAALPDAPELPTLAPPAGGRAAPATAPKKKKKEGC
jgi:hypothetical protein